MKKKFWTDEKIKILLDNWENSSDLELAEMLGVTKQAVAKQRQRLNLIHVKKPIKNTKQYTHEEVRRLFEERGYTLLSEQYVNYTTKLKYICNKHKDKGEQFVSLCDLLRNRGCYYCGREKTEKAKQKPDSYYIEECNKRDFTYVGRYIKDQCTYIKYICNKHSNMGVQEKCISNFEKTIGCPFCRITKNEDNLKDLLLEWGYNIKCQKRFNDCKDKNTLPFDFYLIDFNILIEFDGEFHYMPIRKGNQTNEDVYEKFLLIKKHDKIKNNYCKNKNIKLIRIPYWEKENLKYYLWDKLVECGAIEEINKK